MQFVHLGETNPLVISFFHSDAHVFEFPSNYQHKTQISVGHSEENINWSPKKRHLRKPDLYLMILRNLNSNMTWWTDNLEWLHHDSKGKFLKIFLWPCCIICQVAQTRSLSETTLEFQINIQACLLAFLIYFLVNTMYWIHP